jgi:hypothetical protein
MDNGKLLYHVVDSIASRVQGIENDMFGVMKSHWIKAVEDIDDLEKLAELYGIEREEYEDINQFRTKIEDTIRLYLAGPGTVPSVIEFVGIALRKYSIELERNEDGSLAILHPLDGNESRTGCYFKYSDDSPEASENYLEINENPIEKKFSNQPVRHLQKWSLENKGFFDSCPEITFRGYKSRTVNPVISNRSTGDAIGFRGKVDENSLLKLTLNQEGVLETAELDGKKVLNGNDIKSSIFSLKVAQFDRCNFDELNSNFAIYKPYWALNRDEYTPDYNISASKIPVGKSEWEFRIGERESAFNGSNFDENTFTFPDALSGAFDKACFGESIFQIDFSAGLEISWKENQRAMFEVILPCSLGLKQINPTNTGEQERQFMEPLQRVRKIVERVKPLGVDFNVKYNCDGNYTACKTRWCEREPISIKCF